jgi:hypothetical protein
MFRLRTTNRVIPFPLSRDRISRITRVSVCRDSSLAVKSSAVRRQQSLPRNAARAARPLPIRTRASVASSTWPIRTREIAAEGQGAPSSLSAAPLESSGPNQPPKCAASARSSVGLSGRCRVDRKLGRRFGAAATTEAPASHRAAAAAPLGSPPSTGTAPAHRRPTKRGCRCGTAMRMIVGNRHNGSPSKWVERANQP